MVANLNCQLDWIWSHHGNTSRLSLQGYFKKDLGEQRRPTLNVDSPIPWVGPRWRKENVTGASALISAASSLGTHCDQPSDVLHRASPHHAGTIPPHCEQKVTLPSVASLKYFISAMRKVTNTKVCSLPRLELLCDLVSRGGPEPISGAPVQQSFPVMVACFLFVPLRSSPVLSF